MIGRPVKGGSHGDWAGIRFGEIELAFIRVEGYRASQWPDSEHPKQFPHDARRGSTGSWNEAAPGLLSAPTPIEVYQSDTSVSVEQA